MKQFIYADYAATTPVSASVLKAMKPFFCQIYGNPSSLYAAGREAKRHLELAREATAQCLHAEPAEIFFTSCGSEADNWALKGTARYFKRQGKCHIITTKFEHHAILHACKALEQEGISVTYLDIPANGILSAQAVANAIRPDTFLVSVMYANNEIGTIQPVAEIGAICHEKGILFHTDAVQAAGTLPIDVKEQNIDLLSISAHKFHGPKGVGALYVRRGIDIQPFMDGGAQERGRRGGTENLAGIIGLSTALQEACTNMEEQTARVSAMRDHLLNVILQMPGVHLNGDTTHRLPGNINVCFEGVDGESLLLLLDHAGICASSGSACTAGSLEPSHVLLALGVTPELARGSLRLSFGAENTEEEINFIIKTLPDILARLRNSEF